jgi:hypothetical protein
LNSDGFIRNKQYENFLNDPETMSLALKNLVNNPRLANEIAHQGFALLNDQSDTSLKTSHEAVHGLLILLKRKSPESLKGFQELLKYNFEELKNLFSDNGILPETLNELKLLINTVKKISPKMSDAYINKMSHQNYQDWADTQKMLFNLP